MAKDMNGKVLPKGIQYRKDGRYMGRLMYKGDEHFVYDKDVQKAVDKLENLRYELRHDIFVKETCLTVDGWYNTWINEYKAYTVKKGTIIIYENAYNGYIKKKMGRKKLKDIRPEHIQKLYNELAVSLSRSTILNVSQVLQGMYKQAVINGIVTRNPAEKAKIPKTKEQSEKIILSVAEQKTFLSIAKKYNCYNMIKLALFTGMRSGELRALLWEDLDFDKSIIKINRTLKYTPGNGYFFDTPKTKTSRRDIPMLDDVKGLLKEQKKQQAERKMLLGQRWRPVDKMESLVFDTHFGRPIQSTTFNKNIKDICEEAKKTTNNFPVISPHSLRHTFATRSIENGIPIKVLQTILGHATYGMTADLYAHVLPNTKAEEMKKIANLF